MSDGERACLVPSKELKLEARQNFNTFQLLFIPLSFFKLLNLAVDLTASSGSTRKRHANHLVRHGEAGARILGYVSLPYRY